MRKGYTQRVIARLREQGLKVTPQRIAILKHLDGNTSHPSVEDIHRKVCRAFPTISLATVYNTLDTLEQLREVQSISVDPHRKHYDPDTRPHHHAICSHCHSIQDVFADLASAVRVPTAVAEIFRVDETTVHLRGVCLNCSTATA
ncbi:MAG: transcriptional repressor [Deferrisomatales bacterium]|nr:transcriptional repressor [Deferrisomatales bacterium]